MSGAIGPELLSRLRVEGDQPDPLFPINRRGPRVGSMFSGYAGLDMAVLSTLGGQVVWHCEYEPPSKANPRPSQAAAKVLAHRFPGVPNHGDVSAIDWSAVEPVDVLTGGFPCTDLSLAGQQLGLKPGTRSGLWTQMAYAVSQLRPRLVVIENVRGILSADAHCDLEPCPWCLGDDEGRPLRALGAVLGDLAGLGYDTRWCGLRAADVGAPHGRFRIFIVAWPAADTDGDAVRQQPVAFAGGGGAAVAGFAVRHPDGGDREGWEAAGLARQAGPSTRSVADADSVGSIRAGAARGRGGRPEDDDLIVANADSSGREGPQPASGRHLSARGVVAEASGVGWGERRPEPARLGGGPDVAVSGGAVVQWGEFEPVVRRWEQILGRPAPAPTQPSATWVAMVARRRAGLDRRPAGMRGSLARRVQLSPIFVEFLMGLPRGWVTDVPGISRSDQLKALGNGVVPQQAEAALRWLLASPRVEEVAA